MPFFKYFRPNVYFDKSIRYNELYFCENSELNDPNDLNVSYYFEDDTDLWQSLLSLKPTIETWDLSLFIDTTGGRLASKLNDLFKGVQFESTKGSVRGEVESRSKEIFEIFKNFIKLETEGCESFNFLKEMQFDGKVEWCKLSLIALLARAVDHKFHSVSFSKSALEPMMWAHYADGFKGCVVIYDDLGQGKIGLRHNQSSSERMFFDFLEVNYIDGEKKVPILGCAVSGQAKAQNAFLKKNSFWRYEREYRLLTAERVDTALIAMGDVKKKNNRERILHHDTNDIIGIIFGPQCNPHFKEKTELALRDNRFFHNRQPFFSLDTKLSHEGKVVVSSAAQCLCFDQKEMRQILDEQQLQNLLLNLKIDVD